MATAAMATTAGAAVILYYTGWIDQLPWSKQPEIQEEGEEQETSTQRRIRLRKSRAQFSKPARPPSNWSEALSMLVETLRFTYSETLGKWPIADLAFGINYILRRQGQLHVAKIFAGHGSIQLRGTDCISELKTLLRLITICYSFSKKSEEDFLEETQLKAENVLLREGRAGLLRPAFTAVVDDDTSTILLIIRGTHSMKDTLTVVTGAIVPFHHTVLDSHGVHKVVLGFAHCGMVAAARWIAQLVIPRLQQALLDRPGYKLKVVGHSLGGGTAALLTFILREKAGFADTTCTSFAPAACMTWELAQSGDCCVTSLIHGADLVPTFSASSADDLRTEVTASAWVNDLREQMEQVGILRVVMSSAAGLQQRLSRLGSATYHLSTRASQGLYQRTRLVRGVAAGGNLWRPVSSGTQVVIQQVQSIVQTRRQLGFPTWSCMGPRHQALTPGDSIEDRGQSEEPAPWTRQGALRMERDLSPSPSLENEHERRVRVRRATQELKKKRSEDAAGLAALVDAYQGETDGDADALQDMPLRPASLDEMPVEDVDDSTGDVALRADGAGEDTCSSWYELEAELSRRLDNPQAANEEEEAAVREITREEEEVASQVSSAQRAERADEEVNDFLQDPRRFFPCGRTLHIVRNTPGERRESQEEASTEESSDDDYWKGWKVGLFRTERSLYGRVHLSRSMVVDHFMPNYKKAMVEIVEELEAELESGFLSGVDLDVDLPITAEQYEV